MAARFNVAMWCLRSPCAHLRYLHSHHLTKALRAAIGAAMIAMRIFPRHHLSRRRLIVICGRRLRGVFLPKFDGYPVFPAASAVERIRT
jgi:hypothetical protein